MKKVLFDSFEDISRDYIEEFCACNDMNVPAEGSIDEYNIKSEIRTMDEEDLVVFIEDIEEGPVLITGRLGLWNSSPTIVPKRYDTVIEAIRACVDNMDGYKVSYENGILYVDAYHHDGCNTFEIHKLSKQGRNLTEDTFYNREPKNYWFGKFYLPLLDSMCA